jgi:hypothetical protein
MNSKEVLSDLQIDIIRAKAIEVALGVLASEETNT